jgi:hypothetical protein
MACVAKTYVSSCWLCRIRLDTTVLGNWTQVFPIVQKTGLGNWTQVFPIVQKTGLGNFC